MKRVPFTRAAAQALVEFALAATLIFFLLAAAVDLGLIYMTVQALHNAAQEGANYGSRWLVVNPDGSSKVDEAKVRDRVRNEAGPSGGVSGINLKDLNANGIDDANEPGVQESNIQVKMLTDVSDDGDPTKNVATGADENQPCTDPSVSLTPCYVWVKVTATYKAFFPFATVFGAQRNLSSTYIIPMRNRYARTAPDGGFTQATPEVTPTPITELTIMMERFYKAPGNSPLEVAVWVYKGGSPDTAATVTVKIGGQTATLTHKGNGLYANCSINASNGAAKIEAVDGIASGSVNNSSPYSGSGCS